MLPIKSCSYKIDFVNPDGASPHTHTVTSEIIQTFQSDGSILINGKLYKMQKNGLYFINGLATHFVAPEDINRYNHSIIILNAPEMKQICESLKMSGEYSLLFEKNGGTFCELSPEECIETDRLFLKVRNILKDSSEMKYGRLVSVLTELMSIGISKTNAASEQKRSDKIGDILSFISDNALEKITIDEISEATHISKYHLCRIFKENIGITIGSFIKNRRLSAAKQLLASTELSVTEIAGKCCFYDSSFFTKTFKKEFGMSPSEFRDKYRN